METTAKLRYARISPQKCRLVETAQNNNGLDVDELTVHRIMVDQAPQLKRFAARAKGRGTRIVKRNSHITVVVSDGKKDE